MPHCTRCGRTLVDPASIKRGMGPECAEKSASGDLSNKEKTTIALERAMAGPLPALAVAAAKINSKINRGKSLTPAQVRYKRDIIKVYGRA